MNPSHCRNSRLPILTLCTLVFMAWCPNQLSARPSRPNRIPNGTVFSCSNCHLNPSGGGTRNAFGQAVFDKIGGTSTDVSFWDAELAGQDSDGDGFTNGQELGDSDGDFLNIGPVANVTNPGDPSSKPNRAPGFTSAPVTSASVGVLYSYQATGFDPDNNALTFSKVIGPAWLSVSPAGLVSGTPPPGSGGQASVTIRVTDNGVPALTADQSYTLAVASPNTAPSFTSSPATAATEGVLYSYQASATDPESNPLTFSKVTGPAWLGVSTAGAVSGTPPAGVAGSHAVTIRVADNGSPALTADQSFTLVVSAAFAAWQTQNFTLPAENAIAAANQDPDGDGLPNLVEYALKTPPRQATALTLMSNRVFNGNGQLQFSQVVRDDDPKLSIKWEVNSVLPLGTPAVINAVITDPTPGAGLKTWTFTDTVSKDNATARFSRLKFEMLP